MSSLTKEELKAALTNHGIELPGASARKEELVALYEEYVQPLDQSKGEFSSDDDDGEVVITKRTSRKAATPVKSPAKSADKSAIILEEIVSEVDAVAGEDLSKLTDDELAEMLRQHGIPVGPIVDSTRSIYEKKLARLLGPASADNSVVNGSAAADTSATSEAAADANGSGLKNGEFSAEEEDDDESQPSVVVRKAATPLRRSARTSSKAAAASPLSSPSNESGTSLRQRFGADVTDSARDRFTPTPRRSIHSYKITETTTETVVKSPDGKVSRDFEYRKETSESTDQVGGAKSGVFAVLTKVFVVLVLVGVAVYVYTNYGAQLGLEAPASPEAVEAPVEAAPEAVVPEEAPAQASIGDV